MLRITFTYPEYSYQIFVSLSKIVSNSNNNNNSMDDNDSNECYTILVPCPKDILLTSNNNDKIKYSI